MTAASVGMSNGFVSCNAKPLEEEWYNPLTVNLLDAILAQMHIHPTVGFSSFTGLLESKNARLLVALVEDVNGPPLYKKVIDPQSAFAGEIVPYRAVRILMSATASATEQTVHLTEERWEIGRKKFSLPGGYWVKGPYLMIAALDNASGFTLRARMFPVWTTEDYSTFTTVGSSYERAGMDAIHSLGGVAFAPIRSSQLVQLQDQLGARWSGNLPKYIFLPDMILMPRRGGLITVLEIFGLVTFKPYDEGKVFKEQTMGWINEEGDLRCLSISTKHMRIKEPPHRIIELDVQQFYSDSSNHLWSSVYPQSVRSFPSAFIV